MFLTCCHWYFNINVFEKTIIAFIFFLDHVYFFVAIPGSKDKQHLQTCLEAGLHLADQNNLQAISIPCVGTGGFGLTAADSAQVTFQALKSFRETSKNLRKVRVVVFQTKMTEELLKTQAIQVVQDMLR